MKIPQFSLVEVSWQDASSAATAVYHQPRDHQPIVMKTVGWLLALDKTGLSLANETYREEGTDQYRGWTFVPRGMIVNIRKIGK